MSISTECFVCLVGINSNRHVESFVVCSWQNRTRCRDGVKVLWCHSHIVWLVFESSITLVLVFIQKTLVTCSYFLFCFLGMVREKRGGRGEAEGKCMVHKVQKYGTLLFAKKKQLLHLE